jgi:hypothetical protein
LGTVLSKEKFSLSLKRNLYGGIFGSDKYGTCVILIGLKYKSNNITDVFNI